MKRWIFLLAMPWSVHVSTWTNVYDCKKIVGEKYLCPTEEICQLSYEGKEIMSTVMQLPSKDAYYDFAEVLNEAHTRRTEKGEGGHQ